MARGRDSRAAGRGASLWILRAQADDELAMEVTLADDRGFFQESFQPQKPDAAQIVELVIVGVESRPVSGGHETGAGELLALAAEDQAFLRNACQGGAIHVDRAAVVGTAAFAGYVLGLLVQSCGGALPDIGSIVRDEKLAIGAVEAARGNQVQIGHGDFPPLPCLVADRESIVTDRLLLGRVEGFSRFHEHDAARKLPYLAILGRFVDLLDGGLHAAAAIAVGIVEQALRAQEIADFSPGAIVALAGSRFLKAQDLAYLGESEVGQSPHQVDEAILVVDAMEDCSQTLIALQLDPGPAILHEAN
jgi:hypothetical protein